MTTPEAINHFQELYTEKQRLEDENNNLKILLYRAYTNNFTKQLGDLEEGVALKMKYMVKYGKLVSL